MRMRVSDWHLVCRALDSALFICFLNRFRLEGKRKNLIVAAVIAQANVADVAFSVWAGQNWLVARV